MEQDQHTQSSWRPWLIVSLSFVALGLAYSARAVFGLVMPIWEKELDWSRSFTSGTAATALLMMAVIAPFAGRLVDRQGSRAVILLGLGALSSGCFLIALTRHPWAFFLAFGGVAAVGFGLVATHVVSTAVEQEFDANKGLATGIATSGATGGQFLIVPFLAVLVSNYSWRWAFVALGLALVVMMIGIYRWFPAGRSKAALLQRKDTGPSNIAQDVLTIVKKPAFQILFWSYFICGYTTSGVIETHFSPLCLILRLRSGAHRRAAYGLLSAINLVRYDPAVGWLTDRMNRPLLLGSDLSRARVEHSSSLSMSEPASKRCLLFAILFGLVDYSTVPVTASLVASHLGLRVMGLAFGLITAGHQIGAAFGAYFGGVLFDLYARYDWVWWSSLWLAVAAGVLVFMLRDRPRAAVLVG